MKARILAVTVGVALVIEVADLAGWWVWRRLDGLLEVDPGRAATVCRDSVAQVLPRFAQLARELDGRRLETAPTGLESEALERLGGLQLRWMPTEAWGWRTRSRALRLEDRTAEARDASERALARFPTSPFELRQLARFELEGGAREKALDHLAEAEAIAGGYGLPRTELNEDDQRWLRLEALRRRVDLYPRRQATSRVALARELRARGETTAAADLLSPFEGVPEVRIEVARWDIDRGEPASAISRLDPVVSDRSLPNVLRSQSLAVLAEARSAAGDDEGALSAAREALRLNPRSAAPYVALSRVAETRDDPTLALSYLRRAWGVDPDNVSVLIALARVAETAGEVEDSRLALERAVELRPADPALVVRLVDHHMAHGDLGAAALALTRGRDRFPDDPRLLRLAERLQSELERR